MRGNLYCYLPRCVAYRPSLPARTLLSPPSRLTLPFLCSCAGPFIFFGAMKILLGSCSSFSNIHSCKFINVFVVVVVDVAVGVGVVPRQRRRGVMNAKAAQTDRRQKEFSVRIRIVHYVYATATGYVKWLGLVIFFEYGHCRRLRFLHFCFCGDSRRAASRKKQGQMRRAHMHFFWSTAIFHIGNFQASWKILTK